jgi:glycosyltransferase involved in cell wall biosynthesis
MDAKSPRLLSVVLPLYEEEESVPELAERLASALAPYTYEVIAVDDGSRDGTYAALAKVAHSDERWHVLRFAANAGQTAAIAAGIERAKGDVLVTMDADLENDPADISRLVEKLGEGYDVVSGWRQGRWTAAPLTRRLPSWAANTLITRVTKVSLHDFGCTLKAYRREALMGVDLYGDMHRFIAAYVAARGGRVTELPVAFAPRKYGKSKYGMGRVFKVLMDLVLLVFLTRFLAKPLRFFGNLGLMSWGAAIVALLAALALRVADIAHFVRTPLPLLAGVLFIVGLQLIIFGVLAELLSRVYYESSGKQPYVVREEIGTT